MDQEYPWNDNLLLPSIVYIFGWVKHVPRHIEPKYQPAEEDPFGFENDPSVEEDVPIDEFLIAI